MDLLDKYKYLSIPLQNIKDATNNFTRKSIGGGGFGRVYKGEMSHFKGQGLVAFKRLDDNSDQGEAEFQKEITILSDYKHDNLVSLLGFCKEGPEKILIYEYASNGSLARHLSPTDLTWRQRLKICLQAAKALEYLHEPKRGTHERVIHCDVKSSNILLDDKWNAKLSDFGLSKLGPANQAKSYIITAAIGTQGYIDPLYAETEVLTKESDVYSFGVVLFEVLLGTLCYDMVNGKVVQKVHTWTESCANKKLDEMVSRDLITQMDHTAFKTYLEIAYQCLERSREKRPTMSKVVTELDFALKIQEISEGKEELVDYEEMTRTAEPRLKYRGKAELMILLSKGVLLNSGKTWFTLTKNGGHCEMISMAACLTSEYKYHVLSKYNSKFAAGGYESHDGKFRARVRTQFLSPSIPYTVNLVFKFLSEENNQKLRILGLKYKLEGETNETSVARQYHVDVREDGWLMLELYQFTCDRSIVNLDILFGGNDNIAFYTIQVEGIEFRPLEIIEPKVQSEDGNKDVQTIPDDSDASWEEKLPAGYQDIIILSKDKLQWTRTKELYSILCNGFLANDGQEWVSLDTNGMRCLMLSARAACVTWNYSKWLSLPDSRFGEAFQVSSETFRIVSKIKTQVLLSKTTYAAYLVYKLPQDQSAFDAPLQVKDKSSGSDDLKEAKFSYINLVSPLTPVIRPKADENTHKPLSRPKLKGLPQQRGDGWVEVPVWEFQTATIDRVIPMSLRLRYTFRRSELRGLIVQGIEFRPIQTLFS